MLTMTGYAGGESTSQIVSRRPSPRLPFGIQYPQPPIIIIICLPPILSIIAETTIPEASSTARYLPPGLMLAMFIIWDNVSARRSLIRFWSLVNQYSHTLNKVGSIVMNDLEYLSSNQLRSLASESNVYFASFRFLYFSLLYSVLRE